MTRRLVHDHLLAAAEAVPDKPALVVEGAAHSYAELLDAALRLARGLQDLGLARGDRVAILMENDWPCVVSIYGTLLAGGVLMVVNPQTRPEKLEGLLLDSEARFLLLDEQRHRGALVVPECVQWVVRAGGEGRAAPDGAAAGGGADASAWPSGSEAGTDHGLANAARAAARELSFERVLAGAPPVPANPGTIPLDLAALIYTSGSTGQPKGVMMTHQSMMFTIGSVVEYLRLEPDDRILNVLPLAFSYGLYQLLMSVALGATLVLERSFSFPMKIAAVLQDQRITVFPGVPTIFAALLSLNPGGELSLPTLRCVTNAAAALPEGFVAPMQRLFPNASIFKMYGMTECKRVCYLEPELVASKPHSVGKAMPGVEVLILAESGEPVAPGETGLLHVRGPNVMLGYWRQPELTAHMLKEGRYPGERMLCTQDYFRMDADGFLYFVGRSDDIIMTRGEKVSPVEVENVLHELPAIRSAAVIGVPDEVLGQAVRAYVVLREGQSASEQEIRRHCLARLEGYMVPSKVVIVDALPQTLTGKVQKMALRQAAS